MKRFFILFLAFILAQNIFSQNIIYVKADATGSNNGTSWTNAYTDLQGALSNATAGDTIWVATGTYKPTNGTNRFSSFYLKKHIPVYGGFTGTETNLNQRDWENNLTILSGNIGSTNDATDNSYVVVKGEDSTRIDGFTIQDGYADNAAENEGGGMYNQRGSELIIANCIFKNNVASHKGSAMYNNYADVKILNCKFINNGNSINATAEGGAIYNDFSNIVIDKCYFKGNFATQGGAICNEGKPFTVSNSTIIDNQTIAGGNGGGIYTNRYCKIYNTVFATNLAREASGGGIYSTVGDSIINCTFVNNICGQVGGNIADESSSSVIVNSILMFGLSYNGYDGYDYKNIAGNPHKITYSCYTGYENLSGTGNIQYNQHDMFIDEQNNDFHLSAIAPCIDAANGDYATLTDKDDSLRYDNFTVNNTGAGTPNYVDMGAYEYQHNSPMHGTYTIGATGDFHSFNQAVDSLISLGINDDVTFNVQSGTYNEQVYLPGVAGESEQNTITFQSVSGDSSDVVLTYSSTDENNNYTLKLDSAKYVSFKNMTFKATGSTYARVVHLNNGASFNNFSNCQFIGMPNISELVICNYDNFGKFDTVNVFSNNKFINGAIGFLLITYSYGNEHTITLTNNEFVNQSDKAIYMPSAIRSKINTNYIHSNLYCTGIMIENKSYSDTISNNKIQLNAGGNGIVLYSSHGNISDTTLISNNFIYINITDTNTGTPYNPILNKGISTYVTSSSSLKILYNTVHITGNNSESYAVDIDGSNANSYRLIQNNIFVNEANGQVANYQTFNLNSDYNNYYSNGQYLINGKTLERWLFVRNYNLPPNSEGTDLHSISVNPYFTADTSYHVQNLALIAGTPIAYITTDIDGEQRDAVAPCIGADEFTPSLLPMHGIYTIGGSSADYTSINNAVEALNIRGVDGAVIFNIASGTYIEQILINDIQGLSSTNNITFQSATNDSTDVVINYKAQNDYKNYTICLQGADNISFKHLTIKADTVIGIPVLLHNACFTTISNAVITTVGNSKPLIQIGYDNSDYSPIDTNNVFKNTYFENGRYAIYTRYSTTNNTTVKHNYFRGSGLYLDGASSSKISENTFNINNVNVNHLIAIAIWSGSGDTIINNMIYMRDTIGNNYTGIYTSSGGFVANNTIKIVGGTALQCYANTTILNNVFVSNGRTVSYDDTTNCNIDYNVYYSPSTYCISYYTLAQWQQNTNLDAHSLYYNPVFVSDTNLHTNDSWLNNRGVAIPGITTDIDGQARNTTTPDIGADEFNGSFPLSGVYTIGATGDFPNFTNAVDSMNILGVEDYIIFNVQAGTYNEQIYLADSNITRIPDTAAIVFQSLSGDSTDVVLQNNNAANNYVVYLDSIDYVNINHITIKALDTNNAVVIKTRSSSNNIISNNILQGNGNISPVIYSANGVDNNNTISYNIINNGKYGIFFIGESTQGEENNLFEANILENQYSGGIAVKYQHLQQILTNKITHSNPVEDTTWVGIGVFNCGGNWNNRALVANNMISFNATGKSAGIQLYGSSYINVYFNNVNIFGDNASESRNLNITSSSGDVKNNIFHNTAKGLVYYNIPPADYNDVYTNGDNFAYNNGFISDFESWVSTTGKDQNSVSIDPMFVSDTDLHINQAQLLAKGTYVNGIYTDFDGEQRDTLHPTIGADRIESNCNNPLAGNYTIGSGGDFASLNDAGLTLSLCGIDGNVTFNILPDTYNEQLNISYIRNKTDNDTITFQSQTGNPDDVIIQFDADSANNYVFSLQNQKNIYIKNITLQSLDTTYGRVIALKDTIVNLNLTGNIINGVVSDTTGDNTACIYYDILSADTFNLNMKNNIINNGSYGFKLKTYNLIKPSFTITNNIFNNQNNTAVRLDVNTNNSNNNLLSVTGNEISSNRNPSKGLYFSYFADSCNISSNKIHLSSNTLNCYGLEVYAQLAFVSNNFISVKAIDNNSVYAYHSTWQSKLFNNTFYCYGNEHYYSACVFINNSSNTSYIKNNCLVNLNAEKVIYSANYNNIQSDYNNLYSHQLNGLANWQDTYGLDMNSVSFLPDFVSDTDLHTNSALLYQKGVFIPEVSTDIDGEPRNNPPCIGADEFTLPVFNAGNDTIFCYYTDQYNNIGSYTYDIGAGYDNYQWSNGSDSSSIVIDTTNTVAGNNQYTVTVTIGTNTYTDTVNILYDLPNAISQNEYCYWKNPVVITANPGFDYYHWSNGDTTQSITLNSGGTYDIVVTDNYGCFAKEYVHIDAAYNHPPYDAANINLPDTAICNNQSLTLQANQYSGSDAYNYYTYLWSTGDTTNTLLIDSNLFDLGEYNICVQVQLKENTLCISSDSVKITIIDCSSVDDNTASNINVYPNPVYDKFYIKAENAKHYELYNNSGILVMSKDFNRNKIIDISSFNTGIYVLKVYFDNSVITKKIIKK